MSFTPDELKLDESVDTSNMAPEDDFAPVGDPGVPIREGMTPARQADSGQSRDLEADQFNQQQNLPHAYDQPTHDQFVSPPKSIPEMVGDTPEEEVTGATGQPGPDPVTEDQDEAFSEELLNAAGISMEDAERDFGSPDALQAAVRMLDTRFVNTGREENQQVDATPQQEDIIVEDEDTTFQMPVREDGDVWDPDTIKLAETLNKANQSALAQRDAQIAKQQEYMEYMAQEQQKAASNQALDAFDGLVNSLPAEWTPLLGRGTAHELDPQGLAFNNRMYLEQTMLALQTGNTRSGRSLIPQDELMIRSLSVAFPEAQRAAIRREVTEEVTGQRRLMTARPTQRREQAISRDQVAGKGAEAWYRKHNMSIDAHDEVF